VERIAKVRGTTGWLESELAMAVKAERASAIIRTERVRGGGLRKIV